MSANDLFGNGGGGGAYPKLHELEGKLVLLRPSKVEVVPKPARFGGKPGETQDRATADCVVFEDDGSYEVFDDMYFSQAGIVPACKKALKPGAKPFVLGRVSKVPSKIGKDQGFDTVEKIYEGEAAWRDAVAKNKKGVPEPSYAWGLLDYSDEDVAMAMKYVNDTSPMASAASAE
jgi:hypothetical protein